MISVKGLLIVITVAAISVLGFHFINSQSNKTEVLSEQTKIPSKINAIVIDGKYISLSELEVVLGSDCGADHYHPANRVSAKSLDGSTVFDPDPGLCGFGKINENKIVELEVE